MDIKDLNTAPTDEMRHIEEGFSIDLKHNSSIKKMIKSKWQSFLNSIKGIFTKPKIHKYSLKNIVMCVLTVEEESFLVQGTIWKLEKNGYLIKDMNNTLNNNPNKLWFVKEDDVIELTK